MIYDFSNPLKLTEAELKSINYSDYTIFDFPKFDVNTRRKIMREIDDPVLGLVYYRSDDAFKDSVAESTFQLAVEDIKEKYSRKCTEEQYDIAVKELNKNVQDTVKLLCEIMLENHVFKGGDFLDKMDEEFGKD